MVRREDDPITRYVLVLRAAVRCPSRTKSPGFQKWLRDLRLFEQFLQSDGSDFGLVGQGTGEGSGLSFDPAVAEGGASSAGDQQARRGAFADRVCGVSAPCSLPGNLPSDRPLSGYLPV